MMWWSIAFASFSGLIVAATMASCMAASRSDRQTDEMSEDEVAEAVHRSLERGFSDIRWGAAE